MKKYQWRPNNPYSVGEFQRLLGTDYFNHGGILRVPTSEQGIVEMHTGDWLAVSGNSRIVWFQPTPDTAPTEGIAGKLADAADQRLDIVDDDFNLRGLLRLAAGRLRSYEVEAWMKSRPWVGGEAPRPVSAPADLMALAMRKWAHLIRTADHQDTLLQIAADIEDSATALAGDPRPISETPATKEER